MNKVTRILLVIGLILAVAAPAFAEFKFNGFYRLMGYSADLKDNSEDGDSRQTTYQRFRAKLTYTLNDNVALVYFAEVDTDWGSQSKGALGGGGKLGTDGVNVETKNMYLDLKMGNLTSMLGLQTVADKYEGVVFFEDMAAVNATYKMGDTSVNWVWAKWDEKDGSYTDDTDLYALSLNQKFSDTFSGGATVYFLAEDTNAAITGPENSKNNEVMLYGLNAAAKFGTFGVDGFVVYEDASFKQEVGNDVDGSALAASVKGTMKLENGDLGLRLIYFSNDDDAEDNDGWYMFQRDITGNTNGYEFVNENQMYFLADKFVTDHPKERYALTDAAAAGYGLFAVVLSGNHKLPDNMYANWGAGYYTALADDRNDEAVASREGKTLGFELAARFGKKFFEKVDVSVNAAYAGLGDFYEKTVVGGKDPDDLFKTYQMVNVPF